MRITKWLVPVLLLVPMLVVPMARADDDDDDDGVEIHSLMPDTDLTPAGSPINPYEIEDSRTGRPLGEASTLLNSFGSGSNSLTPPGSIQNPIVIVPR